MKINASQEKLLVTLSEQIKDKLGVAIGYNHWMGAFLSPNDKFVIYVIGKGTFSEETGKWSEGEDRYLYHVNDLDTEYKVFMVNQPIVEFPNHDNHCRILLRQILDSIEEGVLNIPNTIKEGNYSVTQNHDQSFSVEIHYPNNITKMFRIYDIENMRVNSNLSIDEARDILKIIQDNYQQKWMM